MIIFIMFQYLFKPHSKMSEQRHGVVVVGVGRAGSGRIRDLNNFNSHAGLNWSLKGFVSRFVEWIF